MCKDFDGMDNKGKFGVNVVFVVFMVVVKVGVVEKDVSFY